MNCISVNNLSFCYEGSGEYALRDISFDVRKGEFVVLRGPSGCGKSTLLRLLKPCLTPKGEMHGTLRIFGKDTLSFREDCEKIAFVMQETKEQSVCDKVWHELAFTLENLGFPQDEMRRRIENACDRFNISHLFCRDTSTLSGGEHQLVTLASSMAADAELLILDEPASQLSPKAALNFYSVLKALNDIGLTIIMSGHRPLPFKTREIYMDAGKIVSGHPKRKIHDERTPSQKGKEIFSADNLYFSYGKNEILSGVNIKLFKNHITVLEGENGSGKTTLLSQIAKTKGKKIVFLPRRVDCMFSCDTVEDELCEVGFDEEICQICGLDALLSRHPYDLSGGEKMRLAIAKSLTLKPDILLLDEPTRGLDHEYCEAVALLLRKISSSCAVLAATHDREFASLCADSVLYLKDGRLSEIDIPLYQPINEKLSHAVREKCDTACISESRYRRADYRAFAFALIFLPLIAFAGMYMPFENRYLITALLMIASLISIFIGSLERARRSARYLTLIAVLSAVAAVSRAVFAAVPQIKPIAAIVIISGLCLDPSGGFIVGSLSAFLSNIYLGQGPWTPWQMLALGFIGFVFGFISPKFCEKRSLISLLSFFGVLIFYGGFVNLGTLFMVSPYPTLKTAAAVYLQALPFDIAFAASTSVFMWVFIKPFSKKIKRIKDKYRI